jgi:hypothetical protein
MAIAIIAALFVSCSLPQNEGYGTLVIALPGGGAAARAAVSDTFAATLSYNIECDGPGGKITRQSGAGSTISISLNAGNWTIRAAILNAAGQTIGSGTETAVIESGRTTALQMSVNIDTSGNDLIQFAITSPVSVESVIIPGSSAITVSVPFGTNLTGMIFTASHTGVSINPAPGTPLNFSSPQTITVTAENGQEKAYTVTVSVSPPPVPGSTNDITHFAITSPVSAAGVIAPNSSAITVSVPFGTNLAGMIFTASHTGASINPAPGTPLNFSSPQTITVTAENGQEKVYTVTVSVSQPSIPGGTTVWPADATWQNYGFPSGLTMPPGATVNTAGVLSGAMYVYLENADTTAFDYLIGQFTVLDGIPETTNESGFRSYERAYTYSGEDYTLSLSFMPYENGLITLSIEPDDSSAFTVWPDDSQWAVFNLSGLTQPVGTTVGDVYENANADAGLMLIVVLKNIDHTAYDDLLNQISARLGSPNYSNGSSSTPIREDGFMSIMGASYLTVSLEIDISSDEIIIGAMKNLSLVQHQ